MQPADLDSFLGPWCILTTLACPTRAVQLLDRSRMSHTVVCHMQEINKTWLTWGYEPLLESVGIETTMPFIGFSQVHFQMTFLFSDSNLSKTRTFVENHNMIRINTKCDGYSHKATKLTYRDPFITWTAKTVILSCLQASFCSFQGASITNLT